jgi:trimeric autotransporter adhesin
MANLNIGIIGNTVTEGIASSKLNFTISISEVLTSELSLKYSTSNGTAVSGKDYTAVTSGLITFKPGETVKTVSVDILNDDITEVDKNVLVNVFIPKSTTFNLSTSDLLVATGTGTITDTLSATTTTVLADSTTTDKNTIENLTLTGTANINGKGNKLNNILTGNSGTNLLEGVDGQDTLYGRGGGADTLNGGLNNDTYIIYSSGYTIIEDTVVGAGIDTVQASFNYTLGANLENAILTGSAITGKGNELNNLLIGNNSNNALSGNTGDDTLQGNAGNDSLNGEAGNDTYIIDTSDIITEAAGAGTDTVSASFSYSLSTSPNLENIELLGTGDINAIGNSINNKLLGNSGNNNLSGNDGNDILNGGSGDDTLNGESGNDLLEGGLGNDTLNGSVGDDTYVLNNPEDINDVINESANSGTDQVNSTFSYTLQTDLENLVLIGTENINGTGNSAANSLIGNSSNNVLDGLAGSDVMAGGLGNDTYIVEQNTDTVIEEKVLGIDTVESSIDYVLANGNNVENLLLTGTAVSGTGNELNNYLLGNSSGNNLTGNAGLDTLDGGVGKDTMTGGIGNDVYVVDSLQDQVVETPTTVSEIDLVQSFISYTLGNNLENLELKGVDLLTGTGNSLNNKITGNSGNNNLLGGLGNDSLDGGLGSDSLDGGDGNDLIAGSDGNETLIGGLGNDSLDGGLGNDSLDGGDGNDTLKGGLDNDSLDGGLGNDSLDGGLGNDNLDGGLGDDIYVVDDFRDLITTLGATDGTDLVQSSITYRLGSNLENLTLTGSNNINGVGNELNNIMLGNGDNNIIEARNGNDSIDGSGGNDILKGESGNDTLKGNTGNDFDTLIGGINNDDYYVGSTEDVIIENLNEGIDQVFSTATIYTLSENIENLTLSGIASINGTGNTLNNTLSGNSGLNLLDGGAGSDTMAGGTSNDNYIVDTSLDVITETSTLATEIDSAYASSNYTLGSNVENLILTGTANLTSIGNSLNNLLMGNSGNNTLKGNDGNDILDGNIGIDTLEGGIGNDTYVIDNTADVITELAHTELPNSRLDTAKSWNDYTLADNVENLVLLGNTDLKGTGNTLANLITGNSGNNELNGASENDTLIGGAGNDTLIGGIANDRLSGGLGADRFAYNSGATFSGADFGSDRIVDFSRTEGDKITLGKTTFGLTSAVGNGLSIPNEFTYVTTDSSAKISTARIVYSSETGNIFYNDNGSTIGDESILTNLRTTDDVILPSLSASDFIIV